MNQSSSLSYFLSWAFGILVIAAAIINIFWGNDRGFGIFLFVLSFLYFPPVNDFIKLKTGLGIHFVAKILLGIFIVWAVMGVGELPDKINLMIRDFN